MENIDLRFYKVRIKELDGGGVVYERHNPLTNKWIEIPQDTYDWIVKMKKDFMKDKGLL